MPNENRLRSNPKARSRRTGTEHSETSSFSDQSTAAPARSGSSTRASDYKEYTAEQFERLLQQDEAGRAHFTYPDPDIAAERPPEITPATPRGKQDDTRQFASLSAKGRTDASSLPSGFAPSSGYEADASNLGLDSTRSGTTDSSRSDLTRYSGYNTGESSSVHTEALQRPRRVQDAEETARQAKETAAQQRAANEAAFNRFFRALSGKDTAASREQKEDWASQDVKQGAEPSKAQLKREASKNRKLDVSQYADKEADEKGKIRDLKIAGLYSASTRISDDSLSFTRKSTVLGGLGQRKETFAINENGLASLERTAKTTKNLFGERSVNYAVGGGARTVEVKVRGGLLSRSTEESADGTKFETGRKIKGFYETRTGELNENGQRVRETKNSFFGIKYGSKTELTDAKGKPIAKIGWSSMGSSWKREATADGRIKDTNKKFGFQETVIRDAQGIAQVSSKTGPLRREQSFVTGEKSGSSVTSMGRLFRSETVIPVDGEHKTRKMNLLGIIKWDARVKMTDKEIAVRDVMKEKRPATVPQAPKTVRERVNDVVHGVQDAGRSAYKTADRAVRDGVEYARKNPKQTAMYAAGAVGVAGLALAGAKFMGSAGVTAAAGQAARSGWTAAQKAWSGLNQTAARSHELQALAREPAGAFRQSHQARANQPTFSFGVRPADPRTASLDPGRSSSGVRATIGERVNGLNGQRPGLDASKSLIESDPNRSWARYGSQVVSTLSTPQGRQSVLNDIGNKAWNALPNWNGKAANTNTTAKAPVQTQQRGLDDRSRGLPSLAS
jgi:hypothetical protein